MRGALAGVLAVVHATTIALAPGLAGPSEAGAAASSGAATGPPRVAARSAGVAPPIAPAAVRRRVERLIASPARCPAKGAGATAQERQMLCLTNFARRAEGLSGLVSGDGLRRAAAHKDADILGCDEFSHEACGRAFTYWIERFTDCRAAAENIAWGTGPLGGPRAIFHAWMHSPGHRENVLGPYAQIGIALRLGDLEGNGGARVWTQDFGASC